MTTIIIVQWTMYLASAVGIGAALAGIYSVGLAFARGQDQLYQKIRDEKRLKDGKTS